ncbi:MAG: hypothetical protein SFV15_07905 [Polyangiaceae bacterium]|nr:hypothetical protein [Polyangiaceae bacterium]
MIASAYGVEMASSLRGVTNMAFDSHYQRANPGHTSSAWRSAKSTSALLLATFLAVVMLSACSVRISGLTPAEFVGEVAVKAAISGAQYLANLPEERKAERRAQSAARLSELAQKGRANGYNLSAEEIRVLESEYQPFVDEIVAEIRRIQEQQPPDSPLNRKGRLPNVRLRIINASEFDAFAYRGIDGSEIQMTSALVVESTRRLSERIRLTGRFGEIPDDGDNNSYTPDDQESSYEPRFRVVIEFSELMRFLIGHEAAHIWLDQSTMDERDREIEADAWGIEISGRVSEVLNFRARSMRTRLQITSDYQRSLVEARSGPELFLLLYEKDGIFSKNSARQQFAQRQLAVSTKHDEVSKTYAKSLGKGTIASFSIRQALMGFDFEIGDKENDCQPSAVQRCAR